MAVLIGLVGASVFDQRGCSLSSPSDADVSIVRQVKTVRVRGRRGRGRKGLGKKDLFEGLNVARQPRFSFLAGGTVEGNLIRWIPSMRDVRAIVNF